MVMIIVVLRILTLVSCPASKDGSARMTVGNWPVGFWRKGVKKSSPFEGVISNSGPTGRYLFL